MKQIVITIICAFVIVLFSNFSFRAPIKYSKVFTDSVFTAGIEGPAVDSSGNLYVVNFHHEGSIGIIKYGDSVPQLFINLPEGSVGNGICFDTLNNMYVADYKKHNIFKIDVGTKNISVFAHNDKMNQPNDLAIMKNGIMFASDPNWKKGSGNLWRINRDGSTTLLKCNMGTTNGIEVSPDQKTLYVNESKQRRIWKFDLDSNGNISKKKKIASFKEGGLDGMCCDSEGNLYITKYDNGIILILSADGYERIVNLHGQKPTNVALSRDEKKLFVTMQDKKWIEIIEL
ncbi:MAG: SMP-30/gluconolactonase/LRE family protein [Bacteroidetes bacterium]|nr:SMP-30/gluconolactonase/LRE family protein [Bacteroidota bacterium]